MKILASAFSLQMMEGDNKIAFRRLTAEEFKDASLDREWIGERQYRGQVTPGHWRHYPAYSQAAVGHEGTALALSRLLGVVVPICRDAITLRPEDVLLVAQPTGRRLNPGEEIPLPDLTFWRIEVESSPKPIWSDADRREYADLMEAAAEVGGEEGDSLRAKAQAIQAKYS